jgi:hypothetical protein
MVILIRTKAQSTTCCGPRQLNHCWRVLWYFSQMGFINMILSQIMFRVTGDEKYREWGWKIFQVCRFVHNFESTSRGYQLLLAGF